MYSLLRGSIKFQWMLTKRGPPFGPRIWTLFRTLFWTPFWTRKFFWRKKNMTAHAKTCINAVRTRMRLFHQETQANAISKGPAFFPNAPSFFFERTLVFFAARSLPTQARTFFRTYLTFGKNRSRSLLLAEQDVGPNSFVADLKVVTNVRDIA